MILLQALTIVLAFGDPGPKPKPISAPKATNVLVVRAMAADTLVSTVRYTLPTDDGKGPLDSLKVNINNFSSGGSLSQKFTGTLPTSVVFRQALPFTDATWTVTAQICTYRGTSAQAAQCVTVSAPPFVYGLAGPLPVTSASVTNVKVP